jgi:uncharacterized protein
MLRFEWHEKKNSENRRKHGVWFEEAQQVFDDPNALLFYEETHSIQEDRFILLGISGSLRHLVVVHCKREAGCIIRIISARKATAKEMVTYEKGI